MCPKNTAGFLIGKKKVLICILVNALLHVFAENLNSTGLTGKEKLSRHKTNLVS